MFVHFKFVCTRWKTIPSAKQRAVGIERAAMASEMKDSKLKTDGAHNGHAWQTLISGHVFGVFGVFWQTVDDFIRPFLFWDGQSQGTEVDKLLHHLMKLAISDLRIFRISQTQL